MRISFSRRWAIQVVLSTLPLCVSCGTDPPPPTAPPQELDRGLVCIYAGASGVPLELTLWFVGLRAAGVDQAVEGVYWGRPFDNFYNGTLTSRTREFAVVEAARLAQYIDDHPGRPVTLMGYSAGTFVALAIAEALPANHLLDRLILVSSDNDPDYDLTPALDHTRLGAVAFWSSIDEQIGEATTQVGTLDDGYKGLPAASVGFTSKDPRLTQIPWDPGMILYGDFGKHANYVFAPAWIAKYVVPWIAPNYAPATADIKPP